MKCETCGEDIEKSDVEIGDVHKEYGIDVQVHCSICGAFGYTFARGLVWEQPEHMDCHYYEPDAADFTGCAGPWPKGPCDSCPMPTDLKGEYA